MIPVCHLIEYFLTPTETFVDRLIRESQPVTHPTVVTWERGHLDRFPFPGVVEFPGPPQVRSLRRRLAFHPHWLLPPSHGAQRWFRDLVGRGQIRVVHAHFVPAGILAMRLLGKTSPPLVVSGYGYDVSSFPRTPRAAGLARAALLYASRVVALSGHMAQRFVGLGCPAEKIRTVRIFIDLDRFGAVRLPLRQDGPLRLLHVCRLAEKKGTAYIIRALAELQRRGVPTVMTVAGDGPERGGLDHLVAQLGLQRIVTFAGSVRHEQVAELFASHDVFVHPSIVAIDGDEEGTPTAIIEAAAAGMPVIATAHAGIPEIIRNGETGLLVAERSVVELAEAIASFAWNPDSAARMAALAQAHVKREFSPSLQRRRLLDIYEELSAEPERIRHVRAGASAPE